MNTARRIGWVAVLSLALSGCALWNGVMGLFGGGDSCGGGAQALLDQVNWSEAEVIEIRIRQGQFTPSLLRMRQGLPYILRVANADNTSRTFSASEFFNAVAVRGVLVGETENVRPCPSAVSIPAREVAEIHLLAARDGRYTFEDSSFTLPFMPGGGGIGIVTIAPDFQGRPGAIQF
jgi:hypothetical protein